MFSSVCVFSSLPVCRESVVDCFGFCVHITTEVTKIHRRTNKGKKDTWNMVCVCKRGLNTHSAGGSQWGQRLTIRFRFLPVHIASSFFLSEGFINVLSCRTDG